MLTHALNENNIQLNSEQIEKLSLYLEELNRWNKAYNLTAITDPKEQVYKHIIDSLSIREFIQGDSVADIGTGAGLPGIPLAIALPHHHFTLIDSHQKRIFFIQHVLIKLKIKHVIARHQRVEEAKENAAQFDCIISRAFSSLHDFIEKSHHLLNKNGQLLAMKGLLASEELAQIPKEFDIIHIKELSLVGLNAKRHLVIIKKKESRE